MIMFIFCLTDLYLNMYCHLLSEIYIYNRYNVTLNSSKFPFYSSNYIPNKTLKIWWMFWYSATNNGVCLLFIWNLNTSVIFDTDSFDIHLIYILLRIIAQILKQTLMSFVLFQNGGLTSLMYAADRGHLEVASLLILIGCDKEAKTVRSIISDQFDQILLKCIEKKIHAVLLTGSKDDIFLLELMWSGLILKQSTSSKNRSYFLNY